MEEKRNNIIITPQIDSWSKENYPEEFLKLNNYIKSLQNITDKRFKRSTEINIRRIKGNFFDAYNLIVSHNLDKELLFDEIEQNANAETVHDLTGNSSCFGFTPALYSPLGYKELPLVMSARHIYLCTNPFGFYSDNLTHYHNLDISVLEDIPNNLNNVIFMYQGKRQTESIVSVLDYDIPIKDEFGNVTTNKTKLQLIIKPKPIGIKTFFSNLPIESNLLATAFEFNSINNERILYVNKNKKSLAQQLISHSIPNGKDRTEVVSNTGFYKKNIKYYIESVNKNLKLKKPFLYNEIFIDRINLEIEKSENPDVEDIIKNIKKDFLSTSPIPKNIQTISDSVLSFEQKDNDILEIIGKQFETDSSGKPTMNGMKQLSQAMEIYSDKRYETARYLFVKDGVITRHIAVSSQTPSSTIIKPDDKFLYELKNYAEETGSKIVFLHNHPSGYVEPSEADINLTDYLANFFEETDGTNIFSGHIILDHGTYGLYDSKDRSWNALINDEFKPLSKIKENYKIQLSEYRKKADFDTDYSITRQSLEELSDYAKSCDSGNVWNRKDWIPAFLLTGNGIVTSLEYINTLELQNEDSLSEKLKFLGRKYGSESIIMLPSDKQQFLMCERYAQDTGKVKDVFLQSSDGTFEVSDYRNGNIFNDLRADEIKLEDTLTNISSVREKIIEEENKRNENKRFNITSPTQIIYHTNSWKDDFPDLISHKIYREVKKTEELENLRLSAKSGDIDAAVELVNKIVNPETIVNLKEKYPDAIICPIIALEKSGTNKLPFAYANYFHENGFEIEIHIFQNVKAYHTGANTLKRIENRVRFIGEVQKGKDYILIDDHVDFGGTLRDLKDYIETNGGKVVAFSSLTSINQNVRISLSKETIHELEKYGDKLDDTLKYFGVTDNKYGLTESEATGILKLLSDRSRVKELEKGSSKDLGLSLCEIGEEYRKRIKQEEKTRPVYNRFINLISHLSEKELIDYNDSIQEISNKIKSNDTDIIARINHFNKPEFSKKNPAYSEEYLVTKIKEELFYKTSVNNNINKENRIMTEETQIENEKNDISLFDKELQDYIDGKLNKSHIFSLGLPGEILQKCGFPDNQRIELSASHLEFKSKLPRHIFDLSEIKGLEQALKNPVAVFEYGDRKKSQNVVVNIEKDGKNFLAGIHFNQSTRGYEVSDIRTLYPKDNVEWLNWINQGKLIYGDKEKLQALIAQQRMNVAEVSTQVAQSPLYEHCLESASIILDKFTGVNDVFTDEYPFYNEVKEKASIEHKFFTFYVTKGNLDARELSVYEAEEFYNALKNNDTEKIKEYTDTDLHEIQEIAAEIKIEYDSKNIKNEHSQAGFEEISSNTINEKDKLKEKFIPDVKTEDIEEAMDISEDIMSPEQDKNTGKSENEKKLVEKINVLIQENQMLSQKLSTLEQQLLAPKEAQEKSANDSMGQGYNNSSSVEHQNLTNQDGFGRETAYKKNQKVPTFGILQDDGSHQLIKNAVFSKLLVDEENPANNKIELLVLKENGKQEAIQIEEKLYNDIINNVQEFEQRKQGQSKDSWDWMMAHMDYAEKMGIDDNSFRLNTVGNFIHNFRVHCMRDEAHNPEQALKVAGIMFDRMAKREKERFLKMRKQWDKRAKIDGGPTFDEHLIKQFNEFHPKKDINIEQIKGYHFDADEAVDKQNLMYESLRSGKIEGTNTNIGDTISFAMKYKDTFSGKHLKTPKEDWKIVEVSKCLSGDRALIYNEKSKAYYKIPLENLVEQIRKNERLKTKEEKQAIMQDHKKVGYDGPER